MAHPKSLNFGHFLRARREQMGLSRTQFIEKTGIELSEKWLWHIEMNMPEPRLRAQKLEGIARALGYDRNGLERAWKSTPVTAPQDDGKTRKNDLQSIALWITAEAKRLNLDRGQTAERLMNLLKNLTESERDRLYAQASPSTPSPPSHALRIPRPGKDARLRPAAKTISAKPGKQKFTH